MLAAVQSQLPEEAALDAGRQLCELAAHDHAATAELAMLAASCDVEYVAGVYAEAAADARAGP